MTETKQRNKSEATARIEQMLAALPDEALAAQPVEDRSGPVLRAQAARFRKLMNETPAPTEPINL